MACSDILFLEHQVHTRDELELSAWMHEYGLFVSQSSLLTDWYSVRLISIALVFVGVSETRKVRHNTQKMSDLFDLQSVFQSYLRNICCGGFTPKCIKVEYSFLDNDCSRGEMLDFWASLLSHVRRLEQLKRQVNPQRGLLR